jgi:hypothetical protein
MLHNVYNGPTTTIEPNTPINDILAHTALRYDGPRVTVDAAKVDESLVHLLPEAEFIVGEYASMSAKDAERLLTSVSCPGLELSMRNYGDVEDKMDWITLVAVDEATGCKISEETLLGTIVGWDYVYDQLSVLQFCEGVANVLNAALDRLR